MPLTSLSIRVAARKSPLSQAQCEEIHEELSQFIPVVFEPVWIETVGDKDKTTSLRSLDKTDFFTREIDEMLLNNQCRIGIHSAKDLPVPLRHGLKMIALTQGIDSSDVLVINHTLKPGAIIATSSERREAIILKRWPDYQCVDIRGTIGERLAILDSGKVDGVVMAKAALIRLQVLDERKWIQLEGETTPLQGKLAVIARDDDLEIEEIFKPIDTRRSK
jgi:hydroxymethylbilane synthase